MYALRSRDQFFPSSSTVALYANTANIKLYISQDQRNNGRNVFFVHCLTSFITIKKNSVLSSMLRHPVNAALV